MSKERLKQVDDWLKSMYDLLSLKTDEEDRAYTQNKIDLFKWMKEQAEQVQELEETVEDYKAVNKELHHRGRKVRKQNKRYREALDFYADDDKWVEENQGSPYLPDYRMEIQGDYGEVARKALESESE